MHTLKAAPKSRPISVRSRIVRTKNRINEYLICLAVAEYVELNVLRASDSHSFVSFRYSILYNVHALFRELSPLVSLSRRVHGVNIRTYHLVRFHDSLSMFIACILHICVYN